MLIYRRVTPFPYLPIGLWSSWSSEPLVKTAAPAEASSSLTLGEFLTDVIPWKTRKSWEKSADGCDKIPNSLKMDLPSGNLLRSYWKWPFLMGKSTISMAIFNSYVKLPEGRSQTVGSECYQQSANRPGLDQIYGPEPGAGADSIGSSSCTDVWSRFHSIWRTSQDLGIIW